MPELQRAAPSGRLLRTVHPLAGGLALLTVLTFFTATVTVELLGSRDAVVLVKTAIPWGFLILVPALALAGGSGFALDRGSRRAGGKARRMRLIAANGLLILVPAALFLAAKARAGELDGVFYAIQGVELLAGAVNLGLMVRNIQDGRRLAGRPRDTRS